MLKRKLTLMNLPELRAHLELWRGKEKKCKINSRSWEICRWMVEQIIKEIKFKDLMVAGFKKIEKDKNQS